MAVFLVHPSFISILEQFAELRERERGEAAPPRVDPCLSQLSLRLPVNLSSSSLWRLGWAAEGGAGVQLRWSRAGAAFPSAFSGWAGSGASSGQSPPSFHAVAHFSDRSKFNSFFSFMQLWTSRFFCPVLWSKQTVCGGSFLFPVFVWS